MPLGRLLLAAIFLCSLPAFDPGSSVDQRNTDSHAERRRTSAPLRRSTASEPFRNHPQIRQGQDFVLNTPEMDRKGICGFAGRSCWLLDTLCYSIRSYVVKRDSKHSDSVHPAGYSTCVPAARYRLKTADALSLTR